MDLNPPGPIEPRMPKLTDMNPNHALITSVELGNLADVVKQMPTQLKLHPNWSKVQNFVKIAKDNVDSPVGEAAVKKAQQLMVDMNPPKQKSGLDGLMSNLSQMFGGK